MAVITDAHFGGHLLLTKDMTEAGGPAERTADRLGTTSFRYPGGTVTEELDPRDGSLAAIFGKAGEPGSADRVLTVREAFAFAAGRDAPVQFVLPTKTFFIGTEPGDRTFSKAAVKSLLARVDEMIRGEYGEVTIDSFEIGNEYWLPSNRISALEYGRIANLMAKELQSTFDAYRAELGSDAKWVEPKISVQAGAAWIKGDNEVILGQLEPQARAAIDTVVSHFYPDGLEDAADAPIMFGNMEAFREAPGFGKIGFFISEWNIHAARPGDRGMMQASALLEQFDTMIENGVTQANVWGTNYKWLSTRLVQMDHNAWDGVAPEDIDLTVTPAGEVFSIMSKTLIGMTPTEIRAADILEGKLPDAGSVSVHGYERDGKIVVFLASRSAEPLRVDLDLDSMGEGVDHVWGRRLTALDNPATEVDEGDAEGEWARAHVETMSREQLEPAMTLPGYGIVVLEFSGPAIGVRMDGADQRIAPDENLDDHLVGGDGDDRIRGFLGNDVLEGGAGRNIIEGGEGDDILIGGNQRDVIVAGSGDNLVRTGGGNNVVFSGDGRNTILGGQNDDLVVTGDGEATISGRGGANLYLVGGAGQTTITDFDATKDRLDFGGRFGDREDVLKTMRVDGENLVFDQPDGGATVLIGAAGSADAIGGRLLDGANAGTRLAVLKPYLHGLTPEQGEEVMLQSMDGAESLIMGDIAPRMIETAFWPEFAQSVLSVVAPDYEMKNPPAQSTESQPEAGQGGNVPVRPEAEQEDEGPRVPTETGGDGSCFVATAAYGDAAHPDVVLLRAFRDQHLLNWALGRTFIAAYWRHGPGAARRLAPHPRLRIMARRGLGLLVAGLRRTVFARAV